jgi:uncharacterized membrane protein
VNPRPTNIPTELDRRPTSFAGDFRRFFVRGLAALMPTLITLWLLVKVWEFLWEALGRHIIFSIRFLWLKLGGWWIIPDEPPGYIRRVLPSESFAMQVLGVALAIVLVYLVGVLVGNFIGRQFWRLGEMAVMRVPLVRAIYPAVKQVTDLFLADRAGAFAGSRVVAVQHRAQALWTIGLVTSGGLRPLSEATGDEMVTVFVPSTPTAFSGYVVVVPRRLVVELPLSVEDAMRLLVSGGVLGPHQRQTLDGPQTEAETPVPSPRTQAVPPGCADLDRIAVRDADNGIPAMNERS